MISGFICCCAFAVGMLVMFGISAYYEEKIISAIRDNEIEKKRRRAVDTSRKQVK